MSLFYIALIAAGLLAFAIYFFSNIKFVEPVKQSWTNDNCSSCACDRCPCECCFGKSCCKGDLKIPESPDDASCSDELEAKGSSATTDDLLSDVIDMPAIAPVTLKYAEGQGGSKVAVTGCFWGWGSPAVLNSPGNTIDLKLVPGTYEFKFVVDGEWRTSEHYPTVRTYLGDDVRNNVITVDPSSATEHIESAKSAMGVHSSPSSSGGDDVIQMQHAPSVHAAPPQADSLAAIAEIAKSKETVAHLENELHQLKQANQALQDGLSVAQRQTSEVTAQMAQVKASATAQQKSAVDPAYVQQQEQNIAFLSGELQAAHQEINNLRTHLNLAAEEKQRVVELSQRVESLVSANHDLDKKLNDFKDMYARTAFGLTPTEVTKYRAAFDLFDKNKDGHITKEEIVVAIKECGLKPNSKWVQDLIVEADEDESGTIEWPEFLHAMTRHVIGQRSPSAATPAKAAPQSPLKFSASKK